MALLIRPAATAARKPEWLDSAPVPVSTRRLGAATAFDRALQISRKAFGMGSPDWAEVLDDAVRVRFHLAE